MDENQTICSNCRRTIAPGNFRIHRAHCERRIQLCQLCNEPVPRSEFDQHLEDSHSLEECCQCHLPIERWKHPSHKEECLKRPVSCKFCNSENAFDEISEHEEICGSRTEKCISCDIFVKLKDRSSHSEICQKSNSLKSLIVCKYCDLEVLEHKYPEHNVICGARTEKCASCGEFVTLKSQWYHQKFCGKNNDIESLIVCKYCEIMFPDHKYTEHELSCRSLTEKCGYCGEFVIFKDQECHYKYCKKLCESHTRRCDLCDEFVTQADLMNHQKYCKKLLPPSPTQVRPSDQSLYSSECPSFKDTFEMDSAESLSACKFPVEHEKGNAHKPIETKKVLQSRSPVEDAQVIDSDQRPVPCTYCYIEFPIDILGIHIETCQELSEVCQNCKKSITNKDKFDHKRNCMKPLKYEEKKCPLCCEAFPQNEFEQHFNECVAVNFADFEEIQKESKNIHRSEMTDSASNTSSLRYKNDADIPNKDKRQCPYCSKVLPELRFENHKKYCSEALKLCPFCDEKFHVEEEKIHSETCDVLIKNLKKTSFKDSNNRFDVLRGENNEREWEVPFETCSYCGKKITLLSYERHIVHCANELKQCMFCKETFHKQMEIDHLNICNVIKQDQFDCSELQDVQPSRNEGHEQFNAKSFITCPNCSTPVLHIYLESHMKFNCVLQVYCFCKKMVGVRDLNHLEKCLKKHPEKKLNKFIPMGHGARPKNQYKRQEEDKPGFMSKFKNGIKYIVDSVTGTPIPNTGSMHQADYSRSSIENYANSYPYHPSRRYSWRNRDSKNFTTEQEILADTKIPCEFCEEMIPMEEMAIAVHLSTCSRNIIEVPKPIIENLEEKAPICDNNKPKFQQASPEGNRKERSFHFQENSSEIESNYVAELPQVKEQQINNYSFMQNFNKKYNAIEVPEKLIDDVIKNDDVINQLKKGTLMVDMKPNLEICDKISDYLEKNSQFKEESTSTEEYQKNLLLEEKNHEVEENYFAQKINSENNSIYDHSKQFTKPGEFLESSVSIYQSVDRFNTGNNLFGRNCQKPKVDTTEAVSNEVKEKLHYAHKDIDPDNVKLSWREVYSEKGNYEYGKNNTSGEQEVCPYDLHFDTRNHSFKRNSQKPKVDARKNVSNEMKEKLQYAWEDIDSDNPKLYRREVYNEKGDHEYCKNKTFNEHEAQPYDTVKVEQPVLKDDERESKLKFNKEFQEFKENDNSNTKSFQYNRYSVISSEVKGPLKIERLMKTSDSEQEIDQSKMITKDLVHENYYVNQNNVNLERFSKDLLKNKNECSKDTTRSTSQYLNQLEDSRFCQNSKHLTSEEQPMETDNEHHNTRRNNNFYSEKNNLSSINIKGNDLMSIKKSKELEISRNLVERDSLASPDFSDSETMDRNLDSYFEFLKPDNITANSCSVCGNEMCVCQINESISAARKSSFSDNSGNGDFNSLETVQHGCKKQFNEMKLLKFNKDEKVPGDEKWNKWRFLSSSSDDE